LKTKNRETDRYRENLLARVAISDIEAATPLGA
jgi:hypothetical protein